MKYRLKTIGTAIILLLSGCGSDFKAKQDVMQESSRNDRITLVGGISTTQATADGVDQLTVTVKMIDDKSHSVRGVAARLLEDGSFKIIKPCTESNAQGESVCAITSTKAGTRPVHVVYPTEFQTNMTFKPGPVAKILIVAGDNQSATVSTNVLISPKVKVFDAFDNFITQLSVSFTPSGGGKLTQSTVLSNSSGEASPGAWTLSNQVGTNTLTVQAGNITVKMNATGLMSNTNPLRLVYFPLGQCETGKLEVYVNDAPHPKYQYVNAEECIEVEDNVARNSLKIRCVDMTGEKLPSDFVGPSIDKIPTNNSVCKVIHRT